MRSAAHLPAGWLLGSPHPPPPGRWAPYSPVLRRRLALTVTATVALQYS